MIHSGRHLTEEELISNFKIYHGHSAPAAASVRPSSIIKKENEFKIFSTLFILIAGEKLDDVNFYSYDVDLVACTLPISNLSKISKFFFWRIILSNLRVILLLSPLDFQINHLSLTLFAKSSYSSCLVSSAQIGQHTS